MNNVEKLYIGFCAAGITRKHIAFRFDKLNEFWDAYKEDNLPDDVNILDLLFARFDSQLALYVFDQMEKDHDSD